MYTCVWNGNELKVESISAKQSNEMHENMYANRLNICVCRIQFVSLRTAAIFFKVLAINSSASKNAFRVKVRHGERTWRARGAAEKRRKVDGEKNYTDSLLYGGKMMQLTHVKDDLRIQPQTKCTKCSLVFSFLHFIHTANVANISCVAAWHNLYTKTGVGEEGGGGCEF